MLRLIEQLFDEWDAPAAARTCTVALADLAGSPRFVNADEVTDFPLGHVEAVANLVVRLHEVLLIEAESGGNSVFRGNHSNRRFVNDSTKACLSPSFRQDVRRRGIL